MKKRLIATGLLLVASLFVFVVQAAPKYEEDLHYFEVIPAQSGGENGRIQVLEFFWYGCPHCYDLEPYLNNWKKNKPANVDVVLIPAMFKRSDVVMHAQTFYALKLIGEADRLHDKIFDAIHAEKRNLNTQKAMEAFLDEQGVDVEAYRKAMKSFAVKTQATRAAVLAQRFDIRGVPSIVVDGKYRTSGLKGDVLMDVTDYLIDLVQKQKTK